MTETPVPLVQKPAPKQAPPARPLVIASTLEWCARMWLEDRDPVDADLFLAEARRAYDRMVDERVAAGLDAGDHVTD